MSTETSPKPSIDGSNLGPLKQEIAAAYGKINKSKEVRGEANADIAAQLQGLEAKGIHKKAMRLAMTYHEMDEDQRRGFDVAYQVAREALGDPIQTDMFDGPAEQE